MVTEGKGGVWVEHWQQQKEVVVGEMWETDELTRKQVDQGGKQTETQASDLHLGLQ